MPTSFSFCVVPAYANGFLCQAFLGKLPPLAQTALAAVPASATIRKLAEIADKVSESHAQPLSVASGTSSPAAKPQDDTVSLLFGEVRSLSRGLQNLKLQVHHTRSRSSHRNASTRSHSRPSRQGYAGTTIRLGKTPSAAASPALLG